MTSPRSSGAPSPGLYLHVPFCSAICPYCDFAVLTGGPERRRSFVDSLCREIALWKGFGGPYDTVYLGGGTPSHLEPEGLEEVLAAARRHLAMAEDAWIFLEANPEDVTAESLAAWRALGVCFLSLGVQAFSGEALRFLGRRHTGAEARRSVELALGAGFEVVSFDLIYGLPGQSLEAWSAELELAAALHPDHLSCYQLTYHQGTPFGFRHARGELAEMPEPEQAEMFLLAHRYLAERGLAGYEVSNFARSEAHRSRHNAKYWAHVPYLGLGPSAHSFGVRDGVPTRWWNEHKLRPWQERVAAGKKPLAGEETLTPAQLALEAVMLGLRTYAGVDLRALRERTSLDLDAANAALLERFQAEGLVRLENGRLTPTLEGLAVAEGLAARLEI